MQQIKSCRQQLHRSKKLTLARPPCEAGCSRRWFSQSGILAPWSAVPVGVFGALVSSTAPGGSLAGVLSDSTADVEGIIFGSTAEAAGCALFGSTAAAGGFLGALSGSTLGAGAGEILFGSTAVDTGSASFGSSAVGSSGALASCAGRGRGMLEATRGLAKRLLRASGPARGRRRAQLQAR